MQPGHALIEQPPAHPGRIGYADLPDGTAVRLVGMQPLGQLRREARA